MTIYIANVNGDWWEFHPEHPLFVLDTDKIDPELWEAIQEDHELEGDKWEDAIMDHGVKVYINE